MAWLRDHAVAALRPVLVPWGPGPSAPEVADLGTSTELIEGNRTQFQPSNGRVVTANVLCRARLVHSGSRVGDLLLSGNDYRPGLAAGATNDGCGYGAVS
jgi:hypothetical protein